MRRVNFLALAVVAVMAFIASSLWYSPLLLGRQFLELSGFAASPRPNAVALCTLRVLGSPSAAILNRQPGHP